MHWWLAAALLLSGNAWGVPEIIDFEEHWDDGGVIGAPYVMRGRVVAARDLTVARPVRGAKVELTLRKGEVSHRAAATTDADGVAWIIMPTDDFTPGEWHRSVSYEYPGGGGGAAGGTVEFDTAIITRVATDRPVYEPDQTVRWRVTSLHGVNGRPNTGKADVLIQDPHGVQIWRGEVALDDRGMAAGELPLGRDARRGRWDVSATVAGATSSTSFRFKRVELAPFSVSATRIGDTDRWRVRATYPYGEPVQGTMAVKVAPLEGRPRPLKNGEAEIELQARAKERFTAEITVRDGAERIGRTHVTVAPETERRGALAVLGGPLVKGVPGWATVITTDVNGDFAAGPLQVRLGEGTWRTYQTDGAVRIPVAAREAGVINLDTRFGKRQRRARLDIKAANEAAVDVRQNVVSRGETIRVRGRWPDAYGSIVATLFHSGAPIAQYKVQRDRKGRVRADIPAPAVVGLVQVRLHDTGWVPSTDDDKAIETVAVDVYVRPLTLDVTLTPDATRFKPGAVAAIQVGVRDAGGAAAAGVGLAASVVDTRLLALGPLPQPLIETIESLDVDGAHAAGIAFAELLRRRDAAARTARAALLWALPNDPKVANRSVPAEERWQAEHERFSYLEDDIIAGAAKYEGRLARYARGQGWRFEAPLHEFLKLENRFDAWKRPVTWAYTRALEHDYRFTRFADDILSARADLLRSVVMDDTTLLIAARAGRRVSHAIPRHLLRDPWGHRMRFERAKTGTVLVSAGPDGRFGNRDDRRIPGIFALRGFGRGVGALGMRRSRHAKIIPGRPMVVGSRGRMAAATGPAVRRNFEGTVLWSIGTRTDAAGQARFEVPLSDRITGWRVEVEAVGADGAVGHAETEVETFLPRFADVTLPPVLAVGDRYGAHAYVTNHGPATTLTLEATVSGALALERPVRSALSLAKGEARRISLPLMARETGEGRVHLTLAADGAAVDRIERTLRVDPPGSMVERAYSARLSGPTELTWTEPEGVGAATATLRIFRSATDLALDGIDSMLRMPHGCFEQTSSSTFPNLLVLDLLRDVEGAQAVRAKARRFIALGYQRLVGYEVSGGGFSWFGEAPANTVLTAYGVLEFADMAKVYPVDPKLIARTQTWLFEQQRDDGSWAPDKKWLHDWKAVQKGAAATTAWVAWTLAEAGSTDPRLDTAIGWLEAQIATLEPFELGLLAGAQTARGRVPTALAALDRHQKDGRVVAGRSLFSRSPLSADIQATALANRALVRAGQVKPAEDGLDWIWSQRSASGWGNTQATVLALRAALGHRTPPLPDGSVVGLTADGRSLPALALSGSGVPVQALPTGAGAHAVTLTGPPSVRADLRVAWRSVDAPKTPVDEGLAVRVDRPQGPITLGHAARFAVRVTNQRAGAVAMPTITVPTPPGFRVDETRFHPAGVARSEDQGDRVVFYLTRLAAGETRIIEWHLQALAAADVLHRPATAFAYYDPDIRGRSAAARVRIEAPRPVALAPAGPRLTAESVGLGRPSPRSRESADQPADRRRSARR